jgi:hypothetical protein
MRDPEMCFECGLGEEDTLSLTTNRNDYVGVEQWSRTIVRDNYISLVSLHQQQRRFANPLKIAARRPDVLFGLDKKCLLITPLRRGQLDGHRTLAQCSRC